MTRNLRGYSAEHWGRFNKCESIVSASVTWINVTIVCARPFSLVKMPGPWRAAHRQRGAFIAVADYVSCITLREPYRYV